MSSCFGPVLAMQLRTPTASIASCLRKHPHFLTTSLHTSSLSSSSITFRASAMMYPSSLSSHGAISKTPDVSIPIRHYAAAATATVETMKKNKVAKSKSSTDNTSVKGGEISSSSSSYQARKEALKLQRRESYERSQQRLLRLATRRDHSPKDVKKQAFRSWWDKELLYHNHLLRMAKRQNKAWRVRVSVMVERLPIVTPDMPSWERDFVDLTDYLSTFGREFPEETGFMYAMDKPEDHVVPTDEELLAGLPFTPAPRETEADATGFLQTRNRQLKTSVFLAIQSNAENTLAKESSRWTLPSALANIHSDTNLLDVAQRAVSNVAGKDLMLWCPSNAPMAVNLRVYNTNLPKEFREDYFGEKIFYYRVQHDRGDVASEALKKKEGVTNWGWLTKEEIVERVTEERGVHQAKFFRYML